LSRCKIFDINSAKKELVKKNWLVSSIHCNYYEKEGSLEKLNPAKYEIPKACDLFEMDRTSSTLST